MLVDAFALSLTLTLTPALTLPAFPLAEGLILTTNLSPNPTPHPNQAFRWLMLSDVCFDTKKR